MNLVLTFLLFVGLLTTIGIVITLGLAGGWGAALGVIIAGGLFVCSAVSEHDECSAQKSNTLTVEQQLEKLNTRLDKIEAKLNP